MSNADHRRLPMGGMEILIPWFARIVSRDTFRGGFQFCPACLNFLGRCSKVDNLISESESDSNFSIRQSSRFKIFFSFRLSCLVSDAVKLLTLGVVPVVAT
tara:strand:+ start:432 stop:734 length:303 start_codon:yes stop_codon:yes gene_type:complete